MGGPITDVNRPRSHVGSSVSARRHTPMVGYPSRGREQAPPKNAPMACCRKPVPPTGERTTPVLRRPVVCPPTGGQAALRGSQGGSSGIAAIPVAYRPGVPPRPVSWRSPDHMLRRSQHEEGRRIESDGLQIGCVVLVMQPAPVDVPTVGGTGPEAWRPPLGVLGPGPAVDTAVTGLPARIDVDT